MRKGHLPSPTSGTPSRSPKAKGGGLLQCCELWIADGQGAGWSTRTINARRDMLIKFSWWLRREGIPERLEAVTPESVRFFLAYLRQPGDTSRWDGVALNAARPARPATVDTYYRCLRAFFNFGVKEGLLDETPLRKVSGPRIPRDQVQPFTQQQAQALVDAAKRSNEATRNTALVMVLLDTGLRVSELCSLSVGDVETGSGELTVTGKGGKRRRVYLSAKTRRILWKYTEQERPMANDDEPLFLARRGRASDAGLTPNGVHKLFVRLGKSASLRDVRCSPHTARHYFAITMLRNGANLFELQQLMGHEDLTVLRRYVALAQADLALVHRKASPAAGLTL